MRPFVRLNAFTQGRPGAESYLCIYANYSQGKG